LLAEIPNNSLLIKTTRNSCQRLKASLHFTVGKICEEQEANTNIGFSKQVTATINEILWRQIKLTAQDLEAFAK